MAKTVRPILATLSHRDQRWQDRHRSTKRRYSTPEAALIRAIPWLLSFGWVGSFVEIACLDSGIQFATARVTAQGKIALAFTFQEIEK